MEKDPWWVKLKRWFRIEIHMINCLGIVKYVNLNFLQKDRTKRFEKWEDAVPYLGKQITVSFVESSDVSGLLTGISLVMDGTEIITALLEVNNNKWEYWKCKA